MNDAHQNGIQTVDSFSTLITIYCDLGNLRFRYTEGTKQVLKELNFQRVRGRARNKEITEYNISDLSAEKEKAG